MYNEKMIDKSSPIPIYHQIYLLLKSSIENKKFLDGDHLYSENEFCEMFDVSRVTIRKALEALEGEGLISKARSKKTVVSTKKKVFFLSEATRFTHDLTKQGLKIKSIIRRVEKITATAKIAEMLKTKVGEEVYVVERVRIIGDQKIGLSISYLKNTIPIELTRDMFNENTSLFQLLEDNGLDIGLCDEMIEAQIPTPELIEILELDNETAIIFRERITYDIHNEPFEYVLMYYNAKYYKYYVRDKTSNLPGV